MRGGERCTRCARMCEDGGVSGVRDEDRKLTGLFASSSCPPLAKGLKVEPCLFGSGR
jgi:hypothetical protein